MWLYPRLQEDEKRQGRRWVYWFHIAAITNNHKLCGIRQIYPIAFNRIEVPSKFSWLKSRCEQSCVPSGSSRGGSVSAFCSFQRPPAFLESWLLLPSSKHITLPSTCVFASTLWCLFTPSSLRNSKITPSPRGSSPYLNGSVITSASSHLHHIPLPLKITHS